MATLPGQFVHIELPTVAKPANRKLARPLGRKFLTIKQTNAYMGFETGYALSKPSKMPCESYSTPAATCKVGAKLATIEGSTCRSCYAKKGMYVFPDVRRAMEKRLRAIRNPNWVAAMVLLIERQAKKRKTPHFRWHDSGDIQDMRHLAKIVRIAVLMPHISFWLPTRESNLIARYRRFRQMPANLIIRESTAMINAPIPPVAAGKNYSTVHTAKPIPGAVACIAPRQKGECRKCRKCWDPTIHCVSYHKH